MNDEPEVEIDVAECIFTLQDENGTVVLSTPDIDQVFKAKKLRPGSKVFVTAKVDVTIDVLETIQQQQADVLETIQQQQADD